MQLYLFLIVVWLILKLMMTRTFLTANNHISTSKHMVRACQTLDYVKNISSDLPKGYKKREIMHMKDVKSVWQVSMLVLPLLIIISFIADVKISNYVILITLVMLSLANMMFFERFFVFFHSLFFKGDSWRFHPTHDLIIKVFPKAFWRQSFNIFLGSVLLFSMIGMVIFDRLN